MQDKMDTEESRSGEWPIWKCALVTAGICAIPLLPMALGNIYIGLGFWVALILIYLTFLRLFGPGFVIEGAILVIILSILIFFLIPVIKKTRSNEHGNEAQPEKVSIQQFIPLNPKSESPILRLAAYKVIDSKKRTGVYAQ